MKGISSLRRQSGVALIVSLLLLFIMTLLAVAGFSNAHIQERSANNIKLQSLAFEAASAGASNAIQFFLDNPSLGEDQLCGSVLHEGWTEPTEWVDMGGIGDATLQQRMYCLADSYPCTDDAAVDCGIRPPRSQLFVHSRGRVMSDETVVSVRDVEVRLDNGNLWATAKGCGAICFPTCPHYEPKQGQCGGVDNDECLDFPSSNVFQVDGDGGPAITAACSEFTEDLVDAIGSRIGNYVGSEPAVTTSEPEDPWGDPAKTAAFRDALRAEAIAATDCQNSCYYENGLDLSGNYQFGSKENPQITFIDGDASLGGGVSGGGILFVTGKLTWNGTPNFDGLMVALGGNFAIDGGGIGGNPGSKEVEVSGGSVVVLNLNDDDSSFGETGFQNTGGGNALYRYDCDMLEFAHAELLQNTTAGGMWYPECERGPQTYWDLGPTELVIASWRENIGWRENHFTSE